MSVLSKARLRFGPFELDVQSAELFKFGQKLKLQGQPIQILSILLEKAGELVTREELRQRLWPTENETFVDFEHGLNTGVRKLRAALGDEAEIPHYIETLPRRGYRFIGKLTEDVMASGPAAGISECTDVTALPCEPGLQEREALSIARLPKRASRSPAFWLTILAVVVLCVPALWFLASQFGPRTLTIIDSKRLTFNEHVGPGNMATLESYDSIQCDGRRVYYTVSDQQHLRYVSVYGGDEKVLPSSLQFPVILHLAPDASTLLIKPRSATGSTETQLWVMSVEGATARKLGDIQAQDAAFAPDGKTIVFAQGQELYVTDLQGSNPAKLATVPGRAFWLRWSPDGTRLRFTVVEPKHLTYTLWELQSNGLLRQLLSNWRKDAQVCCGVWTANAEYFLFREVNANRDKVWSLAENGLPVLQGKPALLSTAGASSGAVVASPLSKKILVSVATPFSEVLVGKPNNGDPKSLDIGLPFVRATYSHDSQMIVGTTQDAEGGALWRVRIQSGERQQLTTAPMIAFMSDISPDGQRIAFMGRSPDQPWKIYWLSADGGALHVLPSEIVNQADPNWSPDGQSILFGQPPLYMAESRVERNLYVYDLRTQKTSRLPGTKGLFSPRWSPDGRYVASEAINEQSLVVLDMTVGQRKQVDLAEPIGHPFWSSDSQWVYFNSALRLFRLRISDGHVEPVPVKIDSRRCSRWIANSIRPDGSLLFMCMQMHRDIYALDWK